MAIGAVSIPMQDCPERDRQQEDQIYYQTGPKQGIIPREPTRIVIAKGKPT